MIEAMASLTLNDLFKLSCGEMRTDGREGVDDLTSVEIAG